MCRIILLECGKGRFEGCQVNNDILYESSDVDIAASSTLEIAIMHKCIDGSANLVFTAQQTIESH